MIEFRQNYTGHGMRRFGNIFRVGDCPCDGYSNHIGIADSRLLVGGSAVHSDMVIWNSEEPVEDSALQLLDCLFGVLQYSVRIEEQDESHLRMSAFWIGFMKEHRKLLLESEFIPEEPQNMYPLITARNSTEALSCVYARDRVVTIPNGVRHFYIANATRCDYVLLRSHTEQNARVTVRNCMGEIVSSHLLPLCQGITCIETPTAGLVECVIE
jgi:alpha-galactosidase